ncbi:MAG: hypothetical protein K0B09_05170 [Bacteroidales bacterium]|nr:hypothetical protein [Bacteroidales bacterium]
MIASGDKMIVVVMVLAIILIGIAAFLLYLERRLDKAEKKLRELENQKNSGKNTDLTIS